MQKKKIRDFCSRQWVWLLAMFMSIQLVSAQGGQIKVSGVVVDQTGDAIIGASVSVVGASQGTVTDLDGKFIISAAPKAILKISYMGYTTQNVSIGNKTDLKITLLEDAKALDEVVITAMGITREAKSLSSAQQSINTESMTEARASNMLDMLSGKAAGMQIVSGGGPLASTRVVIRGNNSLTGNNQPLFVVDGVPILNNSGEDGDLDYGNAINGINPDEIENIEVLKGANAAALYGSDAANGVLLITTKKASRKPGLGITYGFNMGFNSLYNYPTYQNIYGSGQHVRFERNGGVNYYGNSGTGGVNFNPDLPYGIWNPNMVGQDNRSWGMPMLGFDVVGRNGEVKSYVPEKGTIEDMYKTSHTYTNSISLDKVTDLATFRLSYTNIHSDDILDKFNILDRHTFNVRSTAKFTSFFDVDASVRYVYEDVENRGFRNNSNRNPLYAISWLPRDVSVNELIPWKQPDGTPFTTKGFINPFWLLNETSNADDKHWFMGNITFNIKLNEMFRVRFKAATDVQSSKGWSFANLYSSFDSDGEYSRWSRSWKNNNFDGMILFNKRFDKRFNINASFGATSQSIRGDRLYSRVDMLLKPDMKSLANAKGILWTEENYDGKDKQALFGTANFGYNDWFYLDLTARNDWSSSLPKKNNSYFYYSVGSSLIFTDMFKVDKSVLSFAKLRGSYAQVGNDTGFDRLYSGYYKGGSFMGIPYYQGDDVLKNPELKPEKTQSWEVGADIRLWDGRVVADVTYYDKSTKDQIVEADAPLASGYRREVINAGEIRNWGTEFSLSVTPVKTKLISWTTTLNWSKNNSEVVSLSEGVDRFEMIGAENIKVYAQVGKPYGVFYGNDYKRNENGDICVAADGKPMFLPDQYLGCVQPKWFGGWRNSLSIGDFDLGVMLDFQHGGKVWSHTAFRGGIEGTTVQSLNGRWEYTLSDLILGENANERKGMLNAANTVKPGADDGANYVPYEDNGRPKGVQIGGAVYDESTGEFWRDKPSMAWVKPMDHWTHNNQASSARYIYDASYIKLREVSAGYNVPPKYLRKTPVRSVKLSVVGRNVAILHQNTPKGLDPQATTTTGNNQGLERGFNLPMATWGFDIKVSF